MNRIRSSPSRNPGAAKALRGLEVRLLGISRDFGEAVARARPSMTILHHRRLSFRPPPPPSPAPAAARVRFAPLAQEADRLVITNWDTAPGLVALGDVELELEPGQSAALWINRAAPTAHAEPLHEDKARSPGFAFADASPLV